MISKEDKAGLIGTYMSKIAGNVALIFTLILVLSMGTIYAYTMNSSVFAQGAQLKKAASNLTNGTGLTNLNRSTNQTSIPKLLKGTNLTITPPNIPATVRFDKIIVENDHDWGDGEYDLYAYVRGQRVDLTQASVHHKLNDVHDDEEINFEPGTEVNVDLYGPQGELKPISIATVGSEVDDCGHGGFPDPEQQIEATLDGPAKFEDKLAHIKQEQNDLNANINAGCGGVFVNDNEVLNTMTDIFIGLDRPDHFVYGQGLGGGEVFENGKSIVRDTGDFKLYFTITCDQCPISDVRGNLVNETTFEFPNVTSVVPVYLDDDDDTSDLLFYNGFTNTNNFQFFSVGPDLHLLPVKTHSLESGWTNIVPLYDGQQGRALLLYSSVRHAAELLGYNSKGEINILWTDNNWLPTWEQVVSLGQRVPGSSDDMGLLYSAPSHTAQFINISGSGIGNLELHTNFAPDLNLLPIDMDYNTPPYELLEYEPASHYMDIKTVSSTGDLTLYRIHNNLPYSPTSKLVVAGNPHSWALVFYDRPQGFADVQTLSQNGDLTLEKRSQIPTNDWDFIMPMIIKGNLGLMLGKYPLGEFIRVGGLP